MNNRFVAFSGVKEMTQEFLQALPDHIISEVETLDLINRYDAPSLQSEAMDEVLSRTVLIGGKRLRPLLTYLMGEFLGLKANDVRPFAKASELVHAASLAHDDVIDQAQMRRGRTSINAASSNKKAVLAGDYLLADVIVGLTHKGKLPIVEEMARVIQELSQGEWLQLETATSRNYTGELIEEIARCKTSSVIKWCCTSPAIFADHSKQVIGECEKFGDHLGLAFQLIDDTLDFSSKNQASHAKDHLLDLQNEQVNAVIYSWFERNPKAFSEFRENKETSLSSILEGANLDSDIERIRNKAETHLRACHQHLDQIESLLNEAQILDAEILKERRESISVILAFLAARTV